jgi:2,4-dienoyl-CoA reductase-like NADH-dependent reductase (Old Yellow Enzyme family)
MTDREIPDPDDPIFLPLEFKSGLVVKNRLFRSSISGRFDYYNGNLTKARVNWETSFARGGLGAIISSFVPVARRGRILPNYAMIDDDEKIKYWEYLGAKVREAGKTAFPGDPAQSGECRYIIQLSHSGRQQDDGGIENEYSRALSSTSQHDYFHGIVCQAMTTQEIGEVIQQFADAAWRAKEAGLSGVELHGANGYLFTQFLSSAINDRTDEYGGDLRGRMKFLLDVIRAIRKKVGPTFHLQVKTNAVDHDNALYPWRKRGNRLADAIEICRAAVDAGADALHISSGSIFPHPRNPPGDFPLDVARKTYDAMLSNGINTRFNYAFFTSKILGPLFRWWWNYRRGIPFEDIKRGVNLELAAAIKRSVSPDIKVLVTGGFQHAGVIREAIRSGKVDGVTIARPLIANRDLPKLFRRGMDWDDAGWVTKDKWPIDNRFPCTYCNRCLINDIKNPLACYEPARFENYDQMMAKAMEVFENAF